jgi:predicted lipoprotein
MTAFASPKWAPWAGVCVASAILMIAFPPFRIVSLDEARKQAEAEAFNPKLFAADFWDNKLTKAFDQATTASVVLNTLRRDRKEAKEKYARVVGLGGPHHFFLSGSGKVVAIEERHIDIDLGKGAAGEAEVILATSHIFGNEVLNATGLISRSQFPRTNDYNEVSAEVNRIVVEQVVPAAIEQVRVGATVRFVGCSVQIADDDPLPIPMRLVPVSIELEN